MSARPPGTSPPASSPGSRRPGSVSGPDRPTPPRLKEGARMKLEGRQRRLSIFIGESRPPRPHPAGDRDRPARPTPPDWRAHPCSEASRATARRTTCTPPASCRSRTTSRSRSSSSTDPRPHRRVRGPARRARHRRPRDRRRRGGGQVHRAGRICMTGAAWAALPRCGGDRRARRDTCSTAGCRTAPRGAFPWGTFVVNVSGCLILGLLTGLGLYHGLGPTCGTIVGTGGLGAYTTFSTFTFETVRLAEEGAAGNALRECRRVTRGRPARSRGGPRAHGRALSTAAMRAAAETRVAVTR